MKKNKKEAQQLENEFNNESSLNLPNALAPKINNADQQHETQTEDENVASEIQEDHTGIALSNSNYFNNSNASLVQDEKLATVNSLDGLNISGLTLNDATDKLEDNQETPKVEKPSNQKASVNDWINFLIPENKNHTNKRKFTSEESPNKNKKRQLNKHPPRSY